MPQKFLSLSPGDIVDVVAPASSCPQGDLIAGVEELRRWGLHPRVPKNIFSKRSRFCANSSSYQAKHLIQAINASDSKAIFCVRGGYGSQRLIPYLNKLKKPQKQKLFVGYSDITWLHHYFNSQWGWRTLHGPFVCELSNDSVAASTISHFKKFIFNTPEVLRFHRLSPMNDKAKKKASVEGRIVGGNLTLIQTTAGTTTPFKGKGKVVFFEEAGERGYAIDRMLVHMTQAGMFNGIKAMVFGSVTGGLEQDGKSYAWQAIRDYAKTASFPVFKGLPCGHGPRNMSLPLNSKVKIIGGKKAHMQMDLKG